MNLETGWLERQLEYAASEFDKWPRWMKESAEKEDGELQQDYSGLPFIETSPYLPHDKRTVAP